MSNSTTIPPYGRRISWRPRNTEDFGDGGAFPEILVAQYPLEMGRKTSSSTTTSNALAIQVDAEGKVKYDAIARQGHEHGRTVHASFKDLIPLRQRADAGEIDLSRPDTKTVEETAERTRAALARLVSGAVAAQKPKNVSVQGKREAQFVRYTPASGQMGTNTKKQDRIMKIVERQRDPMEPPKFKHKKIPRGPPSPPPPVMHSPPRKLTAEDQENWRIPPPISKWKNSKGFTIPLDKRLAADGRGLTDITINDKFAQLSEALFVADRHAREEVAQRQLMQQRLADKEKAEKEEELRALALKARDERIAATRGRKRERRGSTSRSPSHSRSRSRSWLSHSSRSRSPGSESDSSSIRARIAARREKQREEERRLRQSRMGATRRAAVLASEAGRDISEKIALGLAKPTQSKEGMYDSRLFDQDSGFHAGINEDNPYDKPLFQAQNALASIYTSRGAVGGGNDEDEDGEYGGEDAANRQMDRIQKQGSRFGQALGRGTFKGVDMAERRDGPVQFEKDERRDEGSTDPFNVDKFFDELGAQTAKNGDAGAGGKRMASYGLDEHTGRNRERKRTRMEDSD